jgi:hypothetical protein
MGNHESYKPGHIEGWPTTLNVTWVRSEVGIMKGHLSSLIEHAPAHDQFHDMKEAINRWRQCGKDMACIDRVIHQWLGMA